MRDNCKFNEYMTWTVYASLMPVVVKAVKHVWRFIPHPPWQKPVAFNSMIFNAFSLIIHQKKEYIFWNQGCYLHVRSTYSFCASRLFTTLRWCQVFTEVVHFACGNACAATWQTVVLQTLGCVLNDRSNYFFPPEQHASKYLTNSTYFISSTHSCKFNQSRVYRSVIQSQCIPKCGPIYLLMT